MKRATSGFHLDRVPRLTGDRRDERDEARFGSLDRAEIDGLRRRVRRSDGEPVSPAMKSAFLMSRVLATTQPTRIFASAPNSR
jgi:hypothetical protein